MFYGTSTDHTSQGTVAADGTISFARNKAYDDLLNDTYQGGNAKADLDAVSFGHNQLSDAVVWGSRTTSRTSKLRRVIALLKIRVST